MLQIKISIIVPVYKAMPYLEHCLESLLSQTVIDIIEILCVDDCGGDDSVDYIHKLQKNHTHGNHIKLFSMSSNSGASAARNFGLSKAQGLYVGFVDADDWCELDMYEKLYHSIEQSSVDWGYCLAQKEYEDGGSKVLLQPDIKNGTIPDDIRKRLLVKGVAYFWTGLYRREFLNINSITFPDGKFSEDSYFWWIVVMYSSSIIFVEEVGYHYVIQGNSVSKRPDPTKSEQKQEMYRKLIFRLRDAKLYDKYKKELDFLYVKKGLLIPMIIKAINHIDATSESYNEMINNALEIGVDLDNSYIRRNLKIRLLLNMFIICPILLSKIFRIKYKQDPF